MTRLNVLGIPTPKVFSLVPPPKKRTPQKKKSRTDNGQKKPRADGSQTKAIVKVDVVDLLEDSDSIEDLFPDSESDDVVELNRPSDVVRAPDPTIREQLIPHADDNDDDDDKK